MSLCRRDVHDERGVQEALDHLASSQVGHVESERCVRAPADREDVDIQKIAHYSEKLHTHTHTPVSYTHLTLPTRRTV